MDLKPIYHWSWLFLPDNVTVFKNMAAPSDGMADVPYEGKVFANEYNVCINSHVKIYGLFFCEAGSTRTMMASGMTPA